MSKLAELRSHVNNGSVSIINVIAVPRSVSTALGRALNESNRKSVFVNEPFNRNNRDIELAASSILEAIDPILEASNSPLTVVIKDMSTYLSENAYTDLGELSQAEVWSIRDPLVQMNSLITRIANDITIETGADSVTHDTVLPYLNDVDSFLAKSSLSINYSRTGWSNIIRHYRDRVDSKKSIVVDGGDFTKNPRIILEEICEKINLKFSSSMIDGWRHNYTNVNVGSSRFDTIKNGWTKNAATSTGIFEAQGIPVDLSKLPTGMCRHINEVAIPSYNEMKNGDTSESFEVRL